MAAIENLEEIYANIFDKQKPINLETFNEEMTISQVIKFFGRYNIAFTKTMIQNYIRIGLLPGPVEKRYYVKEHLILLFLIYNLKESFSLEELRAVFSPVLQGNAHFEGDLVRPVQLYSIYSQMQASIEDAFKGKNYINKTQMIEELMCADIENKEHTDLIRKFMVILYTMIETVSVKQLSLQLINELFK